MRTLLILMVVTLLSVTNTAKALSDLKVYSGAWNPEWEHRCKISLSDYETNMQKIIGAREKSTDLMDDSAPNYDQLVLPPQIIAHRGLYTHRLPDDAHAGENTILAFQWAACKGYAGVEIDLRLTQDNKVVMLHDHSLSRTAIIGDSPAPNFDDGYAVNGVLTRGQILFYPETIEETNSSEVKKISKFRTFDRIGRTMGLREISNPNELFFDYLLSGLSDGTLKGPIERVALILDIQDRHVLEETVKLVAKHNMWDRVIFKIWSKAYPFYKESDGVSYPINITSLLSSEAPEKNPYVVMALNPDVISTYSRAGFLASNFEDKALFYVTDPGITSKLINVHGESFLGYEILFPSRQPNEEQKGLQWLIELHTDIKKDPVRALQVWGVYRNPDFIAYQRSRITDLNEYNICVNRGGNSVDCLQSSYIVSPGCYKISLNTIETGNIYYNLEQRTVEQVVENHYIASHADVITTDINNPAYWHINNVFKSDLYSIHSSISTHWNELCSHNSDHSNTE